MAFAVGCSGADSLDGAFEVGERTEAVEVCPAGATVDGIDVSYYQGSVDWGAVAADGVVFAIARINHGDFMDPEFDANWAGMKEAGLVRGAYQYFDAGSDALVQAQIVVDKVGKLGPGDLPAVIDIEAADGQSPDAIASQVQKWLDHVEEGTGKRPFVYTAKYFWQDNVGSDQFVDYPLWVANYYVDCPNLPDSAWSDWVIHQHADNGSVAGIDGAVDLNRWNGTVEQLNAFADGGGGYAAEVVDVRYPKTAVAGKSAVAQLELSNTGGVTWGSGVHLATTEPRDRKSDFAAEDWVAPNRPAAVAGEIPPGDTWAVDVSLQIPNEPGVYREHFGLVDEGVAWFGDEGQGGPADDAIEIEITVVPAGDGEGESSSSNFRAGTASGLEGDTCSVSAVGGRARGASALALWLAMLVLAGRNFSRRRGPWTRPPPG